MSWLTQIEISFLGHCDQNIFQDFVIGPVFFVRVVNLLPTNQPKYESLQDSCFLIVFSILILLFKQ